MLRLTAFEFVAATDVPQLVVLRVKGDPMLAFAVATWFGTVFNVAHVIECDRSEDLVIEGQGLGRPYWNDEPPAWSVLFDGRAEQRRIADIRAAARREVDRLLVSQ